MIRSVSTAAWAAAMGLLCATLATAHAEDRPIMSRDGRLECFRDDRGEVWRVECDPDTMTCLYAPDDELDEDGNRVKPLERARLCAIFDQKFDRASREAAGYTFLPGRPDAPHGWTRDDRGRVFQVNFDLKRRLYLGSSWAPRRSVAGGDAVTTRSGADFGLLVFEYYGGPAQPNRHRVRLVTGELFVAPFSAELILAHYDLSRRYLAPLLRITTFAGPPRRHDLRLNIGLWTEAGHLEIHHTDAADSNLWRFATAQATLDLWQSPRLDSFARVRFGVGVERLFTGGLDDRTAITPSSAFEIDWVLDRKGFHNLTAELSYQVPRYIGPLAEVGDHASRFQARVRYETILLAINDQPLSLRVDAGSEKRSDIPGLADQWALVANAGLRFSLWAPPRPPG